MHRSACKTSRSTNAHDAEHEEEAEKGATTKGNKKAPIDQRMTWFLCNGDDQQCRHRDVIGEVNQRVRQRPRQIARIANDPASQDHRKYRKDKISDLHPIILDCRPNKLEIYQTWNTGLQETPLNIAAYPGASLRLVAGSGTGKTFALMLGNASS